MCTISRASAVSRGSRSARVLTVLGLAAALLASGCVAINTEFRPYEGRDAIRTGSGATKSTVDGMDIWDGEPPYKFEVLGVLKDERPGAIIPMTRLRSNMVEEARKYGGEALIDLGGSSQVTGAVSRGVATAYSAGGSTTASGFGSSNVMRRNSSTFAVIRFVR